MREPLSHVCLQRISEAVKNALTGLNPVYMAFLEALDDSEFDSVPLNDPPGGSVGNFAVTP